MPEWYSPRRPRARRSTVIYARYSSSSQNDESIEQQVNECMKYAEQHGLRVIRTYEDRAISGRTDKRPEFQRMMDAAERHEFSVVLAYKSNRINRNMLHALSCEERLSRNGVRIVYAKEEFGDSAAGRFALRNMMNMNQFYSENMSEDIIRGLMDSAGQCKVVCKVPFGYRKGDDGKYALDEKTSPVVREIFARVLSGDTLSSIADDLNARGIHTANGGKWGKSSFESLLTNERYTGVYIYRDIRIDGGIPKIIDREEFDNVGLLVKAKSRAVRGRRREGGAYLLTGKLFCGHCNSAMTGISGTSRSGDAHYYYVCRTKREQGTCDKHNVRREWIEQLVAEALVSYVLQDGTIEWIADMVMDYARKFREMSDIQMLEDRLNESKKASENIMRAIEAGVFNSQTQSRMLELESEQRELSARLAREKALLPDVSRDKIVYWMRSMREGDIHSAIFRKSLFENFLHAVYLYDDHLKIVFSWDEKNAGLDIPVKELPESTDSGSEYMADCVRLGSDKLHFTAELHKALRFFHGRTEDSVVSVSIGTCNLPRMWYAFHALPGVDEDRRERYCR